MTRWGSRAVPHLALPIDDVTVATVFLAAGSRGPRKIVFASQPLDPAVAEKMCTFLKEHFGNPSSLYPIGRQVKDNARFIVMRADTDLLHGRGRGTRRICVRRDCRRYYKRFLRGRLERQFLFSTTNNAIFDLNIKPSISATWDIGATACRSERRTSARFPIV